MNHIQDENPSSGLVHHELIGNGNWFPGTMTVEA